MSRNEAQTRRDLIAPILLRLGWTNDLIKVEITPGGTDIIDGKPKKRQGRSDYLLCLPILDGHPPLPIAVIEAKKENSSATLGLQQAQTYAKRFNILSNVRPNLNAVALIDDKFKGAIGSSGFTVIRPLEKYYTGFLFLFFTSPYFIE